MQYKRPECPVKVALSITSANKETLELRTSKNIFILPQQIYMAKKCVISTLIYMHQGIEKLLEDPQR